MRTIVAILFSMLLSACSVVDHHAPPNPPAKVVLTKHTGVISPRTAQLDAQGEEALALLKQWYDSDAIDCGGSARPGYLCSGVMLRGTSTSYDYFPWDPSPSAIALGGTSVSWVRRDQTFANAFGGNGLMFYPNDEAPAEKISLETLCTFPTNAFTVGRDSQGCGARLPRPEDTAPCLDLGVLTAAQWIERYGAERQYWVCGWSLRPDAGPISQWFSESLKAHQDPSYLLWSINNEMVVRTWQTGEGARLPLISFFYSGNRGSEMAGRTRAWFDQMRYFQAYGQALPIIRTDMPTNIHQPVTFAYSASDQWFDVGSPTAPADFEDVPTGRTQHVVSRGLHVELTGANSRVANEPLNTPLINGHYAISAARLTFAVQGQGPVRVTFNWGCRGFCYVNEGIASNLHVLKEDLGEEWRFGTFSTVVRGPEYLEIGGAEDPEFILDNIEVTPVDQR